MTNSELAARLAQRRHISKAQAADQIDGVVHDILRRLRAGKPAALPGLGVLRPGKKTRFRNSPVKGPRKRGKRGAS